MQSSILPGTEAKAAARALDPVRGAMTEIAQHCGTPAYVYTMSTLDRDARAVANAFAAASLLLYSLKANPLPALIERVAGFGFGASAVSGGELRSARDAGVAITASALEGVGKTDADLRVAAGHTAAGQPLLWVSVESADEAKALGELCRERGVDVDALIRVNPAVAANTHAHLAVGRADSKFGVDPDEISDVVNRGGRGIRWRGIHVHTGSALKDVPSWSAGVSAGLDAFSRAPAAGQWDTLNIGGGLPTSISGPELFGHAAALKQLLAQHTAPVPARVALEPGRALVAASGWLLAHVLHTRVRNTGEPIHQVILDAGMTELIRPALYGAHHPIVAINPHSEECRPTEVHGPICESTDLLGTTSLPELRRGDLVAIGMAGAYASSMFSSYNGRARPPEVIIEADGRWQVARPRGAH